MSISNGGHNRHDNEPSHHYGFLYDFAGQPWKTQARWCVKFARDAYSNTPNGVLWQRGLRANVRVVCIRGDGFLSCQPGLGRVT